MANRSYSYGGGTFVKTRRRRRAVPGISNYQRITQTASRASRQNALNEFAVRRFGGHRQAPGRGRGRSGGPGRPSVDPGRLPGQPGYYPPRGVGGHERTPGRTGGRRPNSWHIDRPFPGSGEPLHLNQPRKPTPPKIKPFPGSGEPLHLGRGDHIPTKLRANEFKADLLLNPHAELKADRVKRRSYEGRVEGLHRPGEKLTDFQLNLKYGPHAAKRRRLRHTLYGNDFRVKDANQKQLERLRRLGLLGEGHLGRNPRRLKRALRRARRRRSRRSVGRAARSYGSN